MSRKLKLVQLVQEFGNDKSKMKDVLAIFDSMTREILLSQSSSASANMALESKDKKLENDKKQLGILKKGVYKAYVLLKVYAGADIASTFLKEYSSYDNK